MSHIAFTLSESLIQTTEKYAYQKAVFSTSGEFVTFGELDEKTDVLAGFLVQEGIKKGDRVGLFLGKSIEFVIAIYAVAKAGGVFVILNERLKQRQIDYICNDCDVKLIISDNIKFQMFLKNSPEKRGIGKIILTGQTGNVDMDNGFLFDDILLTKQKTNNLPRVIGNDLAAILYTSGSTGNPKGVMLTHENLVDGAYIISRYLDITFNERILSLLPLNFDVGLNQLISSINAGARIYLSNFVFEKDVFFQLEKFKITGLAGIPTIWIRLCNFKDWQDYDLSALRYITNTGGKIPKKYVFKLIEVFHDTEIFLMYGLTEAFRSTFLPPSLVREKPESIGKAIPNVDVWVIDEEGRPCEPGEEGQIVHRGALISQGYWNNPDATAKIIKKVKLPGMQLEEKVVFTGDKAYTDEEGYIFFLERSDEMIKSSGFRISPTEIEEVLYGIEGIKACVVFGIKDAELGARVKAVIQSKIDSVVIADTAKKECMKRLPAYMQPSIFDVVSSELPITASNKLDRSKIKKLYGNS